MKFGQQETPFMSAEQHYNNRRLFYVDYSIDMEKVMRGMFL